MEEKEVTTNPSTRPAIQQTETTDMFTMLKLIPQSTNNVDYEVTGSSPTSTVGTIKSVHTTHAVTSHTTTDVTDNTSHAQKTSSPYTRTQTSIYSSTDVSTTAEKATDTTDIKKYASTSGRAKSTKTTEATSMSASKMLCTCPRNELPSTTISPTTQPITDTGDTAICNSSRLKGKLVPVPIIVADTIHVYTQRNVSMDLLVKTTELRGMIGF